MHPKVARTLPREWRDPTVWPSPPLTAIRAEYHESYLSRKRAIEAYVKGERLKSICEDEAIDTAMLYGLYESCVALDVDGKIKGFRALIPYARNKKYERKSQVNTDSLAVGRGTSGLFSALLDAHLVARTFLASQAKTYDTVEWEARRLPVKHAHEDFLKVLSKVIPRSSYPFNVRSKGREGYRNALHEAIQVHRAKAFADRKDSRTRQFTSGAADFFREVQIDAHRLDKAIPVKFLGRKNRSRIKLLRPWLLVAVECESTAALGWHLSLEAEPSEFDVLCCLYKMMVPWEPRSSFEIDDMSYEPGGGMPSGVLDSCRGRFADTYSADNALAHHANDARAKILSTLHASFVLGKPRTPETRSEIEQLFNKLTHQNIQHLVGGLRPDMSSRERKLAMKASETFGMTPDQMEEYLDVVICNRNGHPASAMYGKTPLQCLSEEEADGLIRADSSDSASWRQLLQVEVELPVRASGGHVPHVNFQGASYTNDMLKAMPFHGKLRIIITINLMDMSSCEAHTTDGISLGTLMAESRWQFRHDYRVRKRLNSAIKDGSFVWVPSKTPEECVRNFLASNSKRPPPSPEVSASTRSAKHSAGSLSPAPPLRIIADVAAGAPLDLQSLLGKRLKG